MRTIWTFEDQIRYLVQNEELEKAMNLVFGEVYDDEDEDEKK